MRLADEQRKGAVATVPMPEPPPVAKAEPRRATESAVRHLEIPIYEPEPAGPTYSSDGESRFRVVMVLAGTVIAGLVIGVGLYAGGGELVSNLFGSEPVAPVDPNPAAITERPIVEIAPVAPIDSMATASIPATAADQPHMTMTERTASIADAPRTEPPTVMENTLPPTASDRPRIDKPAADVVTGSPRTESAPRTEPRPEPRRSTSRADETAAERPTPARAAPKSFTVQVRATPDQAEAKLIAKKLRSKGAKDVEVVRSEKNGVAFYRIRYRSQGTASEAQAVAGRAGYSDTWIVRD
jgi:hypothetical protein